MKHLAKRLFSDRFSIAGSDLAQPSRWGTIPEAAPGNLLKLFGRQIVSRVGCRLGWARNHYDVVFVDPDGAS